MPKNICANCNEPIRIQIHKGTDHCSELCRKELVKRQGAGWPLYPAQQVRDSAANTGK